MQDNSERWREGRAARDLSTQEPHDSWVLWVLVASYLPDLLLEKPVTQKCRWTQIKKKDPKRNPLSLAKGPGNHGSLLWNASKKAEREARMPGSDPQVPRPPPLLAGASEESQWRGRAFTTGQGHGQSVRGDHVSNGNEALWPHRRVASAEANKWSSLPPHPRVRRHHCPPLTSPLAEASCQNRFN